MRYFGAARKFRATTNVVENTGSNEEAFAPLAHAKGNGFDFPSARQLVEKRAANGCNVFADSLNIKQSRDVLGFRRRVDSSPLRLSQAVAHSFQNRAEVERSDSCACFHCFTHFTSSDIRLWSDSDDPNDEDPGALRDDTDRFRGTTAICPHCEYDSVIGSASGYDLSDEFLHLLHDHWHTNET